MRFISILVATAALFTPSLARKLAGENTVHAFAALTATPPSVCQTAHQGYNKTRDAFAAFRNLELYILGSIINDDPTHSELQQAAKWAITQVPPLIAAAKALNDPDPKWERKEFISAKLAFLKFEMKYAQKLLNKGIPKMPWMGKAFNWAGAVWGKLRDLFHTIVTGPSPPVDPKHPPPPPAGVDPNAIIAALDKKLAAIDYQLYELVDAECKMG